MKPQVEPNHYLNASYDSKERFISYWHQISEIFDLQPTKVLEVGIGTGFVSRYLKEEGIDVATLDTLYDLNPDVTGTVLELPFGNETFDVVLCCEVSEHLPYSDFAKVLRELGRVSQKHVILSLPDVTPVYRLNIELPRMRPIKRLIEHPFPRPTQHEFDGQHYWEIGKRLYPLKKIKLDIKRKGFKIMKTYRVFEFYYNRFFILEKL